LYFFDFYFILYVFWNFATIFGKYKLKGKKKKKNQPHSSVLAFGPRLHPVSPAQLGEAAHI
jgi:hypothetical protein